MNSIINHPILWLIALGIFAVIILQTILYMRAVKKVGPDAGFTQEDLNVSMRAGAIASIGPSIAVAIVAISVLPLLGTPAALTRIGMVGGLPSEMTSAEVGANAAGASLGGEGWGPDAFALAFATMAFSGSMFMIVTLIITPIMKRGDAKLQKANPALLVLLPTAALLGAFSSLGFAELRGGFQPFLVVLVSGLVMAGLHVLDKRVKGTWLREWSFGIAVLAGLVAAFIIES